MLLKATQFTYSLDSSFISVDKRMEVVVVVVVLFRLPWGGTPVNRLRFPTGKSGRSVCLVSNIHSNWPVSFSPRIS